MSFKVGQKVLFLRESGGGVIREISGNRIKIEDEHGFLHECSVFDIASVHQKKTKVDPQVNMEDVQLRQEWQPTRKSGKKTPAVWSIDLHIENLTESHAGWTNHEIYSRQIAELRKFFEKAESALIRRLVIIHGVGEGRLRAGIREFLSGKDGVEFFDADYREYGQGATEVIVRYKV